jgi:Protein of unknown function, DUF547
MRRTAWTALGLLGLLALALARPGVAAPAATGEPDTDAWDRALAAHQRDGGVDYAALAADRGDLDAYLGSLAGARPDAWDANRRLAFWVNAYNAVVLHHVLDRYPGIGSVKDVAGFFDRLTFPVAGKELTLDAIESAARKLDPRVHFAVVCASASCPDLRGEAYRGERIDAQLADQTRRFLAEPAKGLRFERRDGVLWLSSIFKWYAGDFTGGSTVVAFFARGGIVDWILPHLPPDLAAAIRDGDPSVRYLDYDWSLNDRRPSPPPSSAQ